VGKSLLALVFSLIEPHLGRINGMPPRRFLVLLVLACTGFLNAEPTTPVVVPPAPVRPDLSGLPSDQRQAAFGKWRADYKTWEDSLTAEQKAEKKRHEDEEDSRRQEAFRRQTRLPLPTDGYTWQQAAAQQWKLDARVIDQLDRDKIAYGPSVKQSFVPYFGGPIFITSDSLLNGFHVLFEDTFREYELRQITELRKNLEAVLQQARKNLTKSNFTPADTAPGWRHAQLVIGPALCILGTPLDFFDTDVRDEIKNQVDKIKASVAVELPAWLEPSTRKLPALDYRSGRPVGFYSEDARLADYFRAVRWLQMIPFRADRDIELAAIGMLGYAVSGADQGQVGEYFHTYSSLLGPTDCFGLPDARMAFPNFLWRRSDRRWGQLLLSKRSWLLRDDWKAWAPDQLPPNASELLSKIEFRVLPAYRLPDSALFQQLADKNLEPEGLAIAVMLGSGFARDHLSRITYEQFDVALAASRAQSAKHESRAPPSLYDDYLNALRTLFAAPPNDAPAFVHNEAWQAKSCQTALAGWAQMRHTFTLQAKQSENYFGIALVPPGFVEPNPEFFARMADLIERARGLLDENRDRWDELASMTRKLEALAHKELRLQPWTPEDESFLKAYGERLGFVMGYEGNSYEVPKDDAPRWAEVHRNIPKELSLAVGIGRPRVIFVLYPWNGMEILCQGSVMSYYEYHSKERLTDEEWKQLLDSPQAPPQPEWIQTRRAK
jgi:hypothetical protein